MIASESLKKLRTSFQKSLNRIGLGLFQFGDGFLNFGGYSLVGCEKFLGSFNIPCSLV